MYYRKNFFFGGGPILQFQRSLKLSFRMLLYHFFDFYIFNFSKRKKTAIKI